MSAREVIAGVEEYHAVSGPERIGDLLSERILSALAAAGYRLIGPDELDPVTVRKCVDVAVQRRAIYENKRAKHSILADESLTRFEMYDHTVEAHEWLEEQLKALTGGGNG